MSKNLEKSNLANEHILNSKTYKKPDELTDDQLEKVSGGFNRGRLVLQCKKCESTRIEVMEFSSPSGNYWDCTCKDCGYHWHD